METDLIGEEGSTSTDWTQKTSVMELLLLTVVSWVTRWLLPLQHGSGDVICSATVHPSPRHPLDLQDKHREAQQTSLEDSRKVLCV